ncbi:MAG: hypothetical protein WCW61_04595 [Patescibacteria group bacterium]|jgi:hypothetical protein
MQKEHLKEFIDFLKSHEAIFHFVYKAKWVKEGSLFISFGIPKIYVDEPGPTLISFWFQNDALLTVIPLETNLEEVFPILNTTEVKRCWISTQSEFFKELSLEQTAGGMMATADGSSLFISPENKLFAEILSIFKEYVGKLERLDQASVVITERL